MKTEYNLINKLDKESSIIKDNWRKRFIHKLISPYYFFLERYCKKKIWNDFIMSEMITNDKIISFLDEQDFALIGDKFIKKELLNDPEKESNPYDFRDTQTALSMIKKDWVVIMSKIFDDNFQFDVENYISLIVDIDIEVAKDEHTDRYYHEPVYTIIIQYWRDLYYNDEKKSFIKWIITFITIIILTIIATYTFINI